MYTQLQCGHNLPCLHHVLSFTELSNTLLSVYVLCTVHVNCVLCTVHVNCVLCTVHVNCVFHLNPSG